MTDHSHIRQLLKFLFWLLTTQSHVPIGNLLVRVLLLLFHEQQPHIWRSSSHISGRAAATYLDEQQPHICVKLRIMLNSAQLSLSWGLAELGNKKYEQSVVEIYILVVIGPEEMPILVFGRHKGPLLKWDWPKTSKFWQSPHFQNLLMVVVVHLSFGAAQAPPN